MKNVAAILRDIHDALIVVLLWPFSEKVVPLPALDFSTKRASEPRKKAYRPGGQVVVIEGQRWRKESETAFDLEWSRLDGSTSSDRDAELTDADFLEIEIRGLDPHKAEIIKPLWASGKGKARIAQQLAAQGFGEDTVKKYVAAFSASNRETAET